MTDKQKHGLKRVAQFWASIFVAAIYIILCVALGECGNRLIGIVGLAVPILVGGSFLIYEIETKFVDEKEKEES